MSFSLQKRPNIGVISKITKLLDEINSTTQKDDLHNTILWWGYCSSAKCLPRVSEALGWILGNIKYICTHQHKFNGKMATSGVVTVT